MARPSSAPLKAASRPLSAAAIGLEASIVGAAIAASIAAADTMAGASTRLALHDPSGKVRRP